MKVKTSVTLSRELLAEIDRRDAVGDGNGRSAFLEVAIKDYLWRLQRAEEDRQDAEILSRCSDRLNRDTAETLEIVESLK